MSEYFTSYSESEPTVTKASATSPTNQDLDIDHSADATASCPECSGSITLDGDDLACEECGLLISDSTTIDPGPEWRATTQEEKQAKRRAGPPKNELIGDKGLSTNMGYLSESDYSSLSPERRDQLVRMRRRSSESKSHTNDSGVNYALGQISRITTALGYQKAVAERAARLFRNAHSEGVAVGRSLDSLSAAIVYIALRIDQKPVTLDDVAGVSSASRESITNIYSATKRELGLPIPPQHPVDYLPRIASEAGVSNSFEQATRRFLEAADGTGRLQGKDPAGVAAAALYTLHKLTPPGTYTAPDEDFVTVDTLADIADIDPTTLLNGRRRLQDYLCGEDGEREIDAPIACPRNAPA